MAKIGYARVSTLKQQNESQIDDLKAAGCERIYEEKISGKNRDRPQLKKMLYNIRPGDLVIVAKIDRLARSTLDLLKILDELTNAGAGFTILDNPALDTTTIYGKLLLDVLAAIGEFERGMIRARTEEGKARARQFGTKSGRAFGRPRKMTADQKREALRRRAAGETLLSIAKDFGVSESTMCRLQDRGYRYRKRLRRVAVGSEQR